MCRAERAESGSSDDIPRSVDIAPARAAHDGATDLGRSHDAARHRRIPDQRTRTLDDPVFAEQVEILYAKLPVALAGSSVVAVLAVAALWSEGRFSLLLGWLCSLLGAAALRWAAWRRRRAQPRTRTAGGWAKLFVAGTALSGSVWGIGVALVFDSSQLPLLVVLAFATGGLCAGASTTASSYLPASASYILPATLPLAGRLVAELDPPHVAMGIMGAAFAVVLVVVGRTAERNVADQVRLRLDREALARRLDAALREIEAANVELQSQLAQSEQLARLGRLAAGVAHEVNNPLSYVIHNLDYVAQRAEALPSYSDLAEALDDARQGAERIRFIVRDLTALAPHDADKLETVHLESLLGSCVKFASHDLEDRAHLVFHAQPSLYVAANPTRLSQVFLNLLTNAAQSIVPGNPSANLITLSARAAAHDMVEVTLSDTGCGIAPDQIDRVFEPFYTTKAVGKGTGLGLSLARSIVEGLGGSVRVRSVVGEGTTFVVRIPAGVSEPATRTAGNPDATIQDGLAGVAIARILIVDDDRLVARSLARALRPHKTEIASGGRAALDRLCDEPDGFDAVLCDVVMPDMDGVELFRLVREKHPTAAGKFIFVTGAATSQAQAFLDGIHHPRVHKPVHPEELLNLIAQISGPSVRLAPLAVRSQSC
ncbi:MAG: hybrid sensor histidine kinase/response regulator [Polyangiaceae bacterium]|nr:hybrid sensor histidine kinase/response regulator [Polyangiaceae bacterium]